MNALARILDASPARLEALQALESHPAGMGACTCAAGGGYVACTCAWGLLVDRVLTMGYLAPQETIATEIHDTSAYAEHRMRVARVRAIRFMARHWRGSLAGLSRRLKLSTARLDTLVPGIRALVRESREGDGS